MLQTKQLDRDEGKDDASQASPVAILHFPVGQVLNLEVMYPYVCGCTYEKEFRCFPLCNHELYPRACWITASRVKEHNEETCRG